MSQSQNGQTGPKTIAGKAKSAKNSTKHGLTAKSLTNSIDQASADAFYKELDDYYKLKSPLEKLLATRMAQHKVQGEKIQRSRELERAIRVNDLTNSPKTVLHEMPDITGTTKGMLLELINYQEVQFPCELTLDVLESICSEISQCYGLVDSEEEFVKMFPKLTTYLLGLDVSNFQRDVPVDERLKVVGHRIQQVLNDGEHYLEHFKVMIKGIDFFQTSSHHLDCIKAEEDAQEVEDLLKMTSSYTSSVAKSKKSFMKTKELIGMLNVFKSLLWHYLMAKLSLRHYESRRALMVELARLPSDREEILLRYQASNEKRLSSDVGEFLTLINHRKS